MATDRMAVSAPQGEVSEAFDEVADRYDLMVALNPGYHAHLRRGARVLVDDLGDPGGQTPARLVDAGCGSGASTRALLDALARPALPATVLGVDASGGMLAQARAKSWPEGVTFAQGRAENLESVCAEAGLGRLDGVFAAYLLRNVTDRDALLQSMHDLLRPGGTLVVQEYSVAGRVASQAVWTVVCRGIVVPLGWAMSRRTRLYEYLWRSVMEMDPVETVMERMLAAGFEQVRTRSVPGWQRGILHTFHARRPV
ncbi:MAG: class I SAM-dependent methyltransferase [Actinomycetota bacterium]|nr:class I SAM-dependent methyltransferase [Actinomycetota bacterium]